MDRCTCGNDNPITFRRYFDEDETQFGLCCSNCQSEWLSEEFEFPIETSTYLQFGRARFKKYLPEGYSSSSDKNFQEPLVRTQITNYDFLEDYLQPGDHIAWKRPYVIWHHAILKEVSGNTMRVVDNDRPGISEKNLVANEELGSLCRIDYPEHILRYNPKRLTLARANSKIGESNYHLSRNNCEHFAVFCKTGVSASHQVEWVIKTIACLTVENIQKVGLEECMRIALPELIEQGYNLSNWCGAGMVVVIEGLFLWNALRTLNNRAQAGDIMASDFVETAIETIVGAIFTTAGTICLSIVGQAIGGTLGTLICPGVGTAIGSFIGAVIFGIVGGVIGKSFGIVIGRNIGEATAAKAGFHDDELICNVSSINVGDHLVLFGSFIHPRCHVLVIQINADENRIIVIRNTKVNGVMLEILTFKSCYRVRWSNGSTRPVRDSLKIASDQLGQHSYSILFYNCKDFVKKCKALKAYENNKRARYPVKSVRIYAELCQSQYTGA